jgi:hypothetical protein
VIQAAHWRRGGADGRESIAAAGEVVSLAASFTPKPQHWGKITSRPQPTRADIELLAFRLGVSVSAAKQALDMGLLNG